MELPNASYASSKYTRMESTVTLVLIPKVSVQCAVSKYLTLSYIDKAMYDATPVLVGVLLKVITFSNFVFVMISACH